MGNTGDCWGLLSIYIHLICIQAYLPRDQCNQCSESENVTLHFFERTFFSNEFLAQLRSTRDFFAMVLLNGLFTFLSATEYHSDADYNSRRVGVVVVVVVVVVHTFKIGLTFERLDRFASYLEGSFTRVSRFTSYSNVMF